jgi:hypothetical protein
MDKPGTVLVAEWQDGDSEVKIYIVPNGADRIRRLEPAHDERFKWFAPFGFVRYADEHGRVWGSPGAPARTPLLKDGVAQKAWFCGPPTEVIDGIKSIATKYPGLENFMIHWAEGLPPKEFKEQLRWFAKDVMPAFTGARTIDLTASRHCNLAVKGSDREYRRRGESADHRRQQRDWPRDH